MRFKVLDGRKLIHERATENEVLAYLENTAELSRTDAVAVLVSVSEHGLYGKGRGIYIERLDT